jgi:hypothetical protein
VLVVSATKNPVKARAGTIGARARWGELRTVHLRDLDPITAGIIRAILSARENAKAAAAVDPATALPGVRHDRATPAG